MRLCELWHIEAICAPFIYEQKWLQEDESFSFIMLKLCLRSFNDTLQKFQRNEKSLCIKME